MIVIGIIVIIIKELYSTEPYRRARVSEAMNLLGGLKNPMVEHYHNVGKWPSVASVGGKVSGRYTSLIKSGGPSYLENSITFYWLEATLKGGELDGKKLRARYILNNGTSSIGDWDCTTEGVLEPVPNEYLPFFCRN